GGKGDHSGHVGLCEIVTLVKNSQSKRLRNRIGKAITHIELCRISGSLAIALMRLKRSHIRICTNLYKTNASALQKFQNKTKHLVDRATKYPNKRQNGFEHHDRRRT